LHLHYKDHWLTLLEEIAGKMETYSETRLKHNCMVMMQKVLMLDTTTIVILKG
jgi:hypothetical protein